MKRLDPESLGVHLGRLLRAAWALCGSRENAEDLVQETVAGILSRPRLLRGEDELAYLLQALRNTFLTSRRTAARRPRVVTTLEQLNAPDRSTAARPEEAVLTAQVFPAIAQLPESFRLALLAVDVAGLSYPEAARALGAPEATIATRVYRARRRVARELDPDRFGAGQSRDPPRPAPVGSIEPNERDHHDRGNHPARAPRTRGKEEQMSRPNTAAGPSREMVMALPVESCEGAMWLKTSRMRPVDTYPAMRSER